MLIEDRVEQLTRSTKEVLGDCILDNGAILAANTDLPYYPETAINYRYVWPRDAAFVIYAADRLGMSSDIKANFTDWLLERAEGFSETGTIIKRYGTNGRHDIGYGQDYQPDQAGTMIWALHETTGESDKKVDQAISLMANGLSRQWQENHFSHPISPDLAIQDLWEDQQIASDEQAVFSYSLATAIHGLGQASIKLAGSSAADNWTEAAASMQTVLDSSEMTAYPWILPSDTLNRPVDASQSGLAWPFAVGERQRTAKTLIEVGQQLYIPGLGMERYFGDTYDGMLLASRPRKVAGRWPLLSFWYATALNQTGMKEEARTVYEDTLNLLPDQYIPEQILPSDYDGKPPSPLAWSHAMFAIASKELGYL